LAEIVNLNRFRKAKARDSAQQEATENRVRFGRTKVAKENDRRAEERREKLLSGKELTDKPADDDPEG
jgi:hypothetical protein